MNKLAIFSSGTGSNAARIIDHFRDHPSISIHLIVCNNPDAGVLNIASAAGIPVLLIEKEQFFRGDAYLPELQKSRIDFIVLAGFLWKIPSRLIQAYPQRIINIHPALLPKYGGKGMYGRHVHEAVIAAGEKESGITIHFVDELYDHGRPIFQAKVIVDPDDTPETLAKKIQYLEHNHFPRMIEETVKSLKR
jgi:phosphoribosylglycinamide formyltransferase-1